MNREDENQEDAERGPGKFSKIAARVIDACLKGLDAVRQRLQNLRGRFGEVAEHGDDRRGRQAAESADEETATKKPSRLRNFLLILAGMLVTTGIGGVVAYRLMEYRLARQTAVVEQMQEEVDATKKENSRQINLMARFQKESAESRQEAREARREADEWRSRIDSCQAQVTDLENQLVQAKRSPPRTAAGTTTRARPRTGNCAVSADNPNGTLKECIEQFNQR